MSKTCSEDNLCSARPCSRHIFGCSLIRNIRRHIFVNHFDFRQGVWAELQKLQLIKAKLLYHWSKMWLFLFLTQIVCNLSQLWISHGNLFLGSIGGKMITFDQRLKVINQSEINSNERKTKITLYMTYSLCNCYLCLPVNGVSWRRTNGLLAKILLFAQLQWNLWKCKREPGEEIQIISIQGVKRHKLLALVKDAEVSPQGNWSGDRLKIVIWFIWTGTDLCDHWCYVLCHRQLCNAPKQACKPRS